MKPPVNVFIFCLFSILCIPLHAQKGSVAAGPMSGHTSAGSARVWMLVHRAQQLDLTLEDQRGQLHDRLSISTDTVLEHRNYFPLTLDFEGLSPATTYRLSIKLDGQIQPDTFSFRTRSNEQEADFSFLLGSCAMSPPRMTRLFYPGIKEKIFEYMMEVPADFMLWLGDYLYYFPKEFYNVERMYEKWIKKRKTEPLNTFHQSMPQYAIWDDHEYGPNNAKSDFRLKDTTLFIFKSFWANPSYGTDTLKGIYSHFRMHDAEFFLMDNRFYTTEPDEEEPAFYGASMLAWLKQKLLASTARVRFIVSGSQILNEMNQGEAYAHYPEERDELLAFIQEHQIDNVIFLTGDRHHTELIQKELANGQRLYDFTCSPLSSVVRRTDQTEEADNPQRIKGTLVTEHNFGRVSLEGEGDSRLCRLEVFDRYANPLWEYIIELK